MRESVLTILCRSDWHWDAFNAGATLVRFKADGTGELVCMIEFNVFVAAQIDWKPLCPPSLDDFLVDTTLPTGMPEPRLAAVFELEMTLTARRVDSMDAETRARYRINEAVLAPAAFLPKIYTVRMDKGNFRAPPFEERGSSGGPFARKFLFRLRFDPSPYPPREEWRAEAGGGPDSLRMWEWRDFCGRDEEGLDGMEAEDGWGCMVF